MKLKSAHRLVPQLLVFSFLLNSPVPVFSEPAVAGLGERLDSPGESVALATVEAGQSRDQADNLHRLALAQAQASQTTAPAASNEYYRVAAQDQRRVQIASRTTGSSSTVLDLQDPRLAGTEVGEVSIAAIRFVTFARFSSESAAHSIVEVSLRDGNKLYLFVRPTSPSDPSGPVTVKIARGVLTPDGKKLVYSELTYSTPTVMVRDLTKPAFVVGGISGNNSGSLPGTLLLSPIARSLVSNSHLVVSSLSVLSRSNQLTLVDYSGEYAQLRQVQIPVPQGMSPVGYSFAAGSISGDTATVRLQNGNVYEVGLRTLAVRFVRVEQPQTSPITQQGLIDKIRNELMAGVQLDRVDALNTGRQDMVAAVALQAARAGVPGRQWRLYLFSTSGQALLEVNESTLNSDLTQPFMKLHVDDTGKIAAVQTRDTRVSAGGIPAAESLKIYYRTSGNVVFQLGTIAGSGVLFRGNLTVADTAGPEMVFRMYDPQFAGRGVAGGVELTVSVGADGTLQSRQSLYLPPAVLASLPSTASNPGFVMDVQTHDFGVDVHLFTREGRFVATFIGSFAYYYCGSLMGTWGIGLPDVSADGRYAIAAQRTVRETLGADPAYATSTQTLRIVNAQTGQAERTVSLKSPNTDRVSHVQFIPGSSTVVRITYRSGDTEFCDLRNGQIFSAQGAVAPLAEYMGPGQEVAFISWKPIDFREAVQAGFTTVYLGIGSFLRMTSAEQQAVIASAEQAGLPTLGFIGGDPEWVNPSRPEQREFVLNEYQRLLGVLGQYATQNTGTMQFSFATDIEPHTSSWWDGDLTIYSNLVDAITVPIQIFSQQHPTRMRRDPNRADHILLTRFEPFWWKNGHVTESGKVIRGLRDFSGSVVASMTYRNNSEQLTDVSSLVRSRATAHGSMTYMLGAETLPAGPGIPAHITFAGQLQNIAAEMLETIQGFTATERSLLRGIFIHSGRAVADQTLDQLLATSAAGAPSYPVLATSGDGQYQFVRRGDEGAVIDRRTRQTVQVVRGLRIDSSIQAVTFVSNGLIELRALDAPAYYFLVDTGTLVYKTHAQLTPDRAQLAYLSGQDLVIYNVATGARRTLRLGTNGLCGNMYSRDHSKIETVSPDGNFVIIRTNVTLPVLIDLRTLGGTFLPGSLGIISQDTYGVFNPNYSIRFLNPNLLEAIANGTRRYYYVGTRTVLNEQAYNTQFVQQQVRDFFGREATASELTHWTSQLAQRHVTQAQLAEAMFNSPEYMDHNAYVIQAYRLLGREADFQGATASAAALKSGQLSRTEFVQSLISSAEFTSRYGSLSNQQFVQRVYRNLLGRYPTSQELAQFTQQLASGSMSRTQMAQAIVNSLWSFSASRATIIIRGLYFQLMRRAPTAVEFRGWSQLLSGGYSVSQIAQGLMSSQEYARRTAR